MSPNDKQQPKSKILLLIIILCFPYEFHTKYFGILPLLPHKFRRGVPMLFHKLMLKIYLEDDRYAYKFLRHIILCIFN